MMVLPSPAKRRTRLRRSKSNGGGRKSRSFVGIALVVFVASLVGMWACIVFVSPRLATQQHSSAAGAPLLRPHLPHFRNGKKLRGDARSLYSGNLKKGTADSMIGIYSAHPRVVGIYAYQLDGRDDWTKERGKGYVPRYTYLTERIDLNFLMHSSQTLRRIRRHDHYPRDTSLADIIRNYKLAIAGSNKYVKTEDPLRHLMLSPESRKSMREIADGSEDYGEEMAEPLNNEWCEATPRHERWMLHSFQTCNFMHEFDIATNAIRDRTKILGNGYWRDVWPVLDPEPSLRKKEKKVAMKTMRYEHDITERNFHRHVRDAIVSERLTSSPRVTDIYSFCGNSGYFEFASEGSLADRLEEHYDATVEAKDREDEGRPDSGSNDSRLMDQHEKLRLAFEAAAGLADLHDADALLDGNGSIISASMVHADITTDQYIKVGDVYKLNDFNRCRFMRRHRGSTDLGGDGKPCGFFVGNNSGKGRAPEEYAYTEETEKVDVYSLGNIFYTILTNMDPWEDESEEDAIKAIMKGERPEVPKEFASSDDAVDASIRKAMHQCWEHKPEDRPRARALADFLSGELSALDRELSKSEELASFLTDKK